VLTSNGQYRTARKEAEERCVPLCANCHRILHWDETHD
jgi:predicted HNH restriction endonuclease